jgi:hypothetical protein
MSIDCEKALDNPERIDSQGGNRSLGCQLFQGIHTCVDKVN